MNISKKKKMQTILLAVLAAVLGLVYAVVCVLDYNLAQQGKETDVYAFEPGSLIGISYYPSGKEQLVLTKEGDIWIADQDAAFPLNQSFADTMERRLTALHTNRLVSSGKESLAAYGLDHPSNEIHAWTDSDEKVILLGDSNPTTKDSYISLEGEDKVYLVDETFRNLFSNDRIAMASRETLPGIQMEKIQCVMIQKDAHIVRLERNPQENAGWSIMQDTEAPTEADEGRVSEFLAQILKLRYEDLLAYDPDETLMEQMGVKEPSLVLSVNYTEEDGAEKTYSLRVGNDLEANKDYCYVFPEGGIGIYSMKKELLIPFEQFSPSDYLSLSVIPVKKEQLQELTVTGADQELNYRLEQNPDQSVAYLKNGSEITEADFNRFYFQLYAFSAEKRVEDVSDQLTQKPVLIMEAVKNDADHSKLKIEIVPFDQNYYAAMINGKANLLVNRQSVNRMLELIRAE